MIRRRRDGSSGRRPPVLLRKSNPVAPPPPRSVTRVRRRLPRRRRRIRAQKFSPDGDGRRRRRTRMHLDDGCEETPPRASSHHHLSLLSSFCAQKSSVLFVPCRKANFEAFWSVSRSFGMEKKAEVLNSLSLSPLSETQRERESARKRSTTSYRRRAPRSREGGAVFCVSLRESERERK